MNYLTKDFRKVIVPDFWLKRQEFSNYPSKNKLYLISRNNLLICLKRCALFFYSNNELSFFIVISKSLLNMDRISTVQCMLNFIKCLLRGSVLANLLLRVCDCH